jgi:hypothetical protein
VEEYDMPSGVHGRYLITMWAKGNPTIAGKELRVRLCTYITRLAKVSPEYVLVVVEDTTGQEVGGKMMQKLFQVQRRDVIASQVTVRVAVASGYSKFFVSNFCPFTDGGYSKPLGSVVCP